MIQSNIYNIHNGIDTAYIYIWVSKIYSVIYIGMTNNSSGPIGRAHGHFNTNGTFRKRFIQAKGIGIENVNDMILLSFPLPKKLEYISEESAYRESVEYLVSKEIQLKRGRILPVYNIISWHDRFPRRTANSEVINIANEIVQKFENSYQYL